jgi:hypothetical protein
MSELSLKFGFWSAFLSAFTFVVFTICFVAILITGPLFVWSGVADYVTYVNENNQFFQHLARLAMLLFGPLFVVLLNCIHEITPDDRKFLSRTSLCFGLVFAALTGINYFVQLSVVRQNIAAGHLDGLIQVVQANPVSAVSAVNMLGWSLFLGLSSLFVGPVFSGSRLALVVKIAFLANGIFCLLGGIGYVFEWLVLLFLSINVGMGGAVMTAAIALTIFFAHNTIDAKHAL